MTGKRLIRWVMAGCAFIGLAYSGSALGAGFGSPIRWSTVRLSDEGWTARDGANRRVELGLDEELQKPLQHILERAKPLAGAAVMVDAQTGQVLAAAEVGNSPEGSLLFEPVAPAASVFKIVTTAALYENTSVTPMTRVCTRGGKREILREHLVPASGPGTVCGPFAHALGVSRNAAYAQLATQKLLRDDLVSMATTLGFGRALSVDANGTVGELSVPYNDLSFARTAAGFENSKLSVFGGAQLALTVASGGLIVPMHFRKGNPDVAPERAFSARTARRLRNAMEVTIHSGTAHESFVNASGRSTVGPVQVAGKTGTLKPSKDAPTASWFVGFAPSENPRVVVSVLLQNPDKWVQKGHQVGRDLLKVYLRSIGVEGL